MHLVPSWETHQFWRRSSERSSVHQSRPALCKGNAPGSRPPPLQTDPASWNAKRSGNEPAKSATNSYFLPPNQHREVEGTQILEILKISLSPRERHQTKQSIRHTAQEYKPRGYCSVDKKNLLTMEYFERTANITGNNLLRSAEKSASNNIPYLT